MARSRHIRSIRIAALICTVALSIIVSGTALSFGIPGQSAPRVGAMSNVGAKVTNLPPSQLQDLQRSGVDADIQFLGTRAGISFFIGTSNGEPCFLTSNSEAPRAEFSTIACLGPGSSRVPSTTEPLVDLSAFLKAAVDYKPVDDAATHLNWLAGFAADGVAAVGVETVDGSLKSTPVINNIYAARRITSEQIVALVALDKDEQVIYRRAVG